MNSKFDMFLVGWLFGALLEGVFILLVWKIVG